MRRFHVFLYAIVLAKLLAGCSKQASDSDKVPNSISIDAPSTQKAPFPNLDNDVKQLLEKLKRIRPKPYRQVEDIRGKADAQAASIYAAAYNQSPASLGLLRVYANTVGVRNTIKQKHNTASFHRQ